MSSKYCRASTGSRPEDRSRSADGHAGEVGREAVGGVSVEVDPRHVIAEGGSCVGVPLRVMNVAERNAADQAGGAEGSPRVCGLVGLVTPAARTTRLNRRLAPPRVRGVPFAESRIGPSPALGRGLDRGPDRDGQDLGGLGALV
jgi:hypothetical protein